MTVVRCSWCSNDPVYMDYHDTEWGVPEYDDQRLFELLNLEGAQAGLSWITVLRKRAHYRAVFDQFDPHTMAAYTQAKRADLLADSGIIRNKLKVNAFIVNAQQYVSMQAQAARGEALTFSQLLWSFVGGKPRLNKPLTLAEVPTHSPESEAMSAALKKIGFKFVGPTICYAFMQASGMVVDHTQDCFRFGAIR